MVALHARDRRRERYAWALGDLVAPQAQLCLDQWGGAKQLVRIDHDLGSERTVEAVGGRFAHRHHEEHGLEQAQQGLVVREGELASHSGVEAGERASHLVLGEVDEAEPRVQTEALRGDELAHAMFEDDGHGETVTQAMYIVVLTIGRLYEHHMVPENVCDA